MGYVGLDPEAATQLRARLDDAARELDAQANELAAILHAAGLDICKAPDTMRNVSRWAAYRSRDLQKRIDKVIAADRGSAPGAGFHFASENEAKKAAAKDAADIKRLLSEGKLKEAEARLARVKPYASDANYAAAFLAKLGATGLATLTNRVIAKDPKNALAILAPIGQMLAVLSRQHPNGAKDGIPKDIRDKLLSEAMVAPLAVLLALGGFDSRFTADAARSLLVDHPMQANMANGQFRWRVLPDDARAVALQALAGDPTAAYLFLHDDKGRVDDKALATLLIGDQSLPRQVSSDHDDAAMAASVLHAALVGYPAIAGVGKADDVLSRIVHDVAHGAPISGPAKVALAEAFREPIVDGRIGALTIGHSPANGLPGFNPRLMDAHELRDTLAVLMGDTASAATLLTAARDYTMRMIQQDEARVDPRNPDTVPDIASENHEVGATLGLLDSALAKHLKTDAAKVKLEVSIIQKATEALAAAGLAASGIGGPAGVLTGKGVGMGIDAAASAYTDHEINQIYKQAKDGESTNLKATMDVAVAQAASDDPRLRTTLKPLPAHLIKDGKIRVDTVEEQVQLADWIDQNQLRPFVEKIRLRLREYIKETEDDLAGDRRIIEAAG